MRSLSKHCSYMKIYFRHSFIIVVIAFKIIHIYKNKKLTLSALVLLGSGVSILMQKISNTLLYLTIVKRDFQFYILWLLRWLLYCLRMPVIFIFVTPPSIPSATAEVISFGRIFFITNISFKLQIPTLLFNWINDIPSPSLCLCPSKADGGQGEVTWL